MLKWNGIHIIRTKEMTKTLLKTWILLIKKLEATLSRINTSFTQKYQKVRKILDLVN